MNLIIKGFIIGIGKIIPGVSGAMLAITLGEYEKIIEAISNIKKNTIKNTKYLSTIGIGIILAITLTSKIIVKCLNMHYFPTMLLFIGMIIGGIPKIIKETKPKIKDILLSVIILLILFLIIKNLNITKTYQVNKTPKDFIKLIGIGSLDAASSIIPGISGTALLMMFGYYNTIIETFATILDIKNITHNLFIMIPFIIGFIIGTVIISKILKIIMKRHKNKLNIIITIFMIITTITILKQTIYTNPTIKEIIIGIILAVIGLILTLKIEK